MRISRVLVQNFRNFRRLEIDPFPSSAVLVGENGVGKSNLLHAMRLVLDPDLPDSARRLRAEDISDHADATLADGVEVRVEVELTDIEADLAGEASCDGCFVNLDPLTARLTYTFRPRIASAEHSGALTRDDYDWSISGGPNDDKDARRFRHDVSLTVLPALRDAVGELSRWRGSPLHELLEARPPRTAALETAAAGIQKVMDDLATDEQITAVATDLYQRLTEMAGPQLAITPTLGFASSVPTRLLRSIRLFVDSNRSRNVADTSTGNANVIYLGLLLERLASRRATDVVVDTVLAVEEPEAHLHPVLQRQLFRYLLRSETSLVVTTHSPHIAAVAELDSLVLLRSDPTGATIAANTAHVALTDSQRADLQRYLDVSRAELLFCTAAILVEGPSEVYLLPALARAMDFDLDAHGVIIANVSGTDFKPYRSLLGASALDVPHVIVTDGDPKTKKGIYRYAGLRRAANLFPEGPEQDALRQEATKLSQLGEQADTWSARRTAMTAGVFVGGDTLEVDIASLLAQQMIDAHSQLETSASLLSQFDGAVEKVALGEGDADDRSELLRRVDHISKGRFAQRLAANVEGDDGAIFEVIAEHYESTVLDESEPFSQRADLDEEELLGLGTYGYLLAALDRISWQVRQHGLISRADVNFIELDEQESA